ncbi:hypothetical protein [Paenibacillus turpanensis]|nr:hypothetical protein [Paenibacillus turpanensis]
MVWRAGYAAGRHDRQRLEHWRHAVAGVYGGACGSRAGDDGAGRDACGGA